MFVLKYNLIFRTLYGPLLFYFVALATHFSKHRDAIIYDENALCNKYMWEMIQNKKHELYS